MPPIHVICLKWGTKYPADYVNKLFHMVERHLSLPHQFHCITENPDGLEDGINALPLFENSLEGWWNKLSIYREDFYGLKGTALFLDLDIVITGELNRLFEYEAGKTVSIQDTAKRQWSFINSSVVRFEIGSLNYVWQGFLHNREWILEHMDGDQDWLGKMVPGISTYPREWIVSYKRHCDAEDKSWMGLKRKFMLNGWASASGEARLPNNASIVIFHGEPNPDMVSSTPYLQWKKAPWIQQHWY